MDSPAPIRVLYVAGCGRSGSTLIDNILGQIDGCFSCGELWHIWRRGLIENRLCSDGTPFRSHPFWNEVFERAFGGMDARAFGREEQLARQARALLTSIRYPWLALGRPLPFDDSFASYIDVLTRLYKAIAETSQSRVLIDSSKSPVYALLVAGLPGVELYALHLVRDPRAVVHSWQRSRAQPDKNAIMDRHGTLWSIVQWHLANASAESLRANPRLCYSRLRYEDFIAAPRPTVEGITQWLDLGPVRIPFPSDTTIETRPNQAFSGNPSRFERGIVKLLPDEEWRSSMPRWKRITVETLLGPAMARYGYR